MSHPPSTPRSKSTARPDRAALLLEAVRQRDGQATAHLVRQWVHRCGPGSLDQYLHQIVAPQAGVAAAAWLEAQINRPLNLRPDRPEPQPLLISSQEVESAVVGQGSASAVDQEVIPAQEDMASMGPSPAVGAPESALNLAEDDQGSRKPAFDFDPWASFPDPPLATQPVAPHADAAPSALGQALGIGPTQRRSWDFGSARIEAESNDPADLGLTDLGPTHPGLATSGPEALVPLGMEPIEQQQDETTGFGSAPLRSWTALRSSLPISKGLRAFSRMKELMRDCLDEAIVGLQSPGKSHDEPVEQPEPSALAPQRDGPSELPHAGLIPPTGPRMDSTRANPVRGTAGTLPSTAARPAPTPEALADLRAWLPESHDSGDFPKAS